MLTLDTTDFNNDLEEYKLQLKLALENAVKEFSIDIVRQVIPYTPIGDSRVFSGWYRLRHEWDSSYPLEEGMTIANWSISVKSPDYTADYSTDTPQGAYTVSKADRTVQSYKLGDMVYIQNTVPYASEIRGESAVKLFTALQSVNISAAKFKDNLVVN